MRLTNCRLPLGEQFQVYVLVEMKMQALPTYQVLTCPSEHGERLWSLGYPGERQAAHCPGLTGTIS